MKQFTVYVTILAMSLPSMSFGLAGGPFDHNNFNTNDAGTYQVIMYFRGGLGQARFSDAQASIFAFPFLTNQAVFYHEGITYFGRAFGGVDFQRDRVTVITQTDSNSANIRLGNEDDDPSLSPNTFNEERNFGFGYGGRPAVLNSQVQCAFTRKYPDLEFQGSGEAQVFIPRLDFAEFQRLTTFLASLGGDGGGAQDILTSDNVPIRFDTKKLRIHAHGAEITVLGPSIGQLGNSTVISQ